MGGQKDSGKGFQRWGVAAGAFVDAVAWSVTENSAKLINPDNLNR